MQYQGSGLAIPLPRATFYSGGEYMTVIAKRLFPSDAATPKTRPSLRTGIWLMVIPLSDDE